MPDSTASSINDTSERMGCRRLVRDIVNALVDAFQASGSPNHRQAASSASPVGAPEQAGEVAAFLRGSSVALQHHTLSLLGRILHLDPTSIHIMCAAGPRVQIVCNSQRK